MKANTCVQGAWFFWGGKREGEGVKIGGEGGGGTKVSREYLVLHGHDGNCVVTHVYII